jgi:Replication-relaxation
LTARPETRRAPQGARPATGETPPKPPPRRPSRPAGRPAGSLLEASARLLPRDYVIATLLGEHTTLTTAQIAAVLFTSETTCAHRLRALRRLGFIDRIIRPGAARAGACWVPGPLSARYVALSRGERPPSLAALRERQDAVLSRPDLGHLLGANQFFVDLLAHARAHPGSGLDRWWSEQRTAAALGRRARPDGHGVWRDARGTTAWFLEMDTGTEPIGRLVAKLGPCQRLRGDGGPAYPVLFWLPSRRREQNLHRRLAESRPTGVTVATAAREGLGRLGPADPVWRVCGNGRRRLALAELPCALGQPGPYHPGPPAPQDDPLHALRQP